MISTVDPDALFAEIHEDPATHEFRRYTLMNGLDSIGLTLKNEDKISAFERRRGDAVPA